eukprot:56789-Eustigmatos_ZCMA.PRE.1
MSVMESSDSVCVDVGVGGSATAAELVPMAVCVRVFVRLHVQGSVVRACRPSRTRRAPSAACPTRKRCLPDAPT